MCHAVGIKIPTATTTLKFLIVNFCASIISQKHYVNVDSIAEFKAVFRGVGSVNGLGKMIAGLLGVRTKLLLRILFPGFFGNSSGGNGWISFSLVDRWEVVGIYVLV